MTADLYAAIAEKRFLPWVTAPETIALFAFILVIWTLTPATVHRIVVV